MGFTAFLRRLSGSDVDDLAVQRCFQERLAKADAKNKELDKLKKDLDEVVDVVSKRQEQAAKSDPPGPADSADHQLELDAASDEQRRTPTEKTHVR